MSVFDDRAIATIADSVRSGEYNLLLGAGVSLDSENGERRPLPTAEAFRIDLCALKGANARSSLQRVFSSLDDDELNEHVIKRFAKCKPGPSLTKVTQFLWRRIYTFNIDDALEAAYQTTGSLQAPAIFHFDDGYVEQSDRSLVPIIHLHGSVRSPNRAFVFSRSEYVRQMKATNPWMVTLTQFLRVDPFIIAGTSLDEVDLEYYLAHRSRITTREDRGPSILVEPNPDSVTQDDCKKYNVLLFEGTFRAFLDFLDANVPNRPRPIELIPESTRQLFAADVPARKLIAFASDFELVPPKATPHQGTSRFLYGHPPTWEDLASHLDVGRALTTELVATLAGALREMRSKPFVLLVLDDTGSGKTTVLRRVSVELVNRGIQVLICSALSRVDANLTVPMIDQIEGPLLIVVDNFADQATAIAEVLRRVTKPDVAFLFAERLYRTEYIRQALSGVPFMERHGLKLGAVETEQLIAIYRSRGLVGAEEAVTETRRFVESTLKETIAVASCRILNDFRPLERIIESICSAADDTDQHRYRLAALAHYGFRGGVRYEILAAITGLDGWSQQLTEMHPLPLAYVDRDSDSFVVPLSAAIANQVLHRTAKEQLLPIFVDLAIAIAPWMNRQAIRARTPEARLAGRMFDYDQVVKVLLGNLAPEFYLKTRDTWQWNSRYWEQLALLRLSEYYSARESANGAQALRDAIQHARHAVSIDRHPFPLTTLGKVLLAQMTSKAVSLADTYAEAFEHLTEAIRMEREWLRSNVQPFIALLRGTRSYVSHGGQLSGYQAATVRALCYEAANRFEGDREVQVTVSEVLKLVE